jgi:lactam utilization protein B
MSDKLNAQEVVEAIRVVHNTLKLLTESESLAGVILTNDTYDQVRRLFGFDARPYNPTGKFVGDPQMDHVFVVGGMLIMRGTLPVQ